MKLFFLQKNWLKEIFNCNFYCIFLIIFIFLSNNAFSLTNIIINGNQNISKKAILSFKPNEISLDNLLSINLFQKKLFETGFFKDVKVSIDNKSLVINVIENPLVNFFYIEGIIQPNLNKKVSNIPKVSENSFFQQHLIKKDIENINSYLSSLGYLENKITYQIIQLNNNKINIFYKVQLNNKFKIKRIFFIGNKVFKSSILLDAIASSEHGWWKFLSNTSTPSENLINYDISKLKNFYLDNGYYDVQINSNSIKILDDKSANIIYSINAGPKYKIGKIFFLDNSSSLKKDDLITIKNIYSKLENEIYNNSFIKRTEKLLVEYLRKSNFDLNLKYKVIKSNDFINIEFETSEYPNKKLLEKIIISGNSITDEFVIRNALLINEGDIFNQSKIVTSIEKLKGNGLFSDVKYEYTDEENNKINIKITVIEKPTGEIAAGAGAGTNGATISGSFNENNFLGKGIKLNSMLNLGTEKIFGKISYSNPDFDNSGNSFNSTFFIENNDFKNASYSNKVIGLNFSTNYEIYDKVFLNPGMGFDYDTVSANDDASQLIKSREGDYYTSKIFYNLSKNTKNREFQTTDGYVVGAGQGFSILSDSPYINNRFFGSYYNEYKDGFVVSFKSKLETINGINDDIKFSDRLYVNSNNLRGFSNRGIGPKISGDFIGGNYSYYGNISSTFPNGLPEKWNAITNVFFDTANVWGVEDNSTDESNKIRSSVGLGLSWVSPIGPIAITYAEPVTKNSTDDLEQFNFKIGSAF